VFDTLQQFQAEASEIRWNTHRHGERLWVAVIDIEKNSYQDFGVRAKFSRSFVTISYQL
jgi:hypothetical protein